MKRRDTRNEKATRRGNLRQLDLPLMTEIDDSGEITLEGLRDEVAARNLLGTIPEDATLAEWWIYTQKRRLLTSEGSTTIGAAALSEHGGERLEEAQAANAVRNLPGLKNALAPWIPVATAIAGALVALGINGVIPMAWTVVAGSVLVIVILWVLIVWATDKLMNLPAFARIDRHMTAMSVRALDGKPEKRIVEALSLDAVPPMRLYSDLPAIPTSVFISDAGVPTTQHHPHHDESACTSQS